MAKPNFVVFEFWDRVDNEIYNQNITKIEVANRCGFNRKILSSYSNLSLVRLCNVLHVNADYLLFGKE